MSSEERRGARRLPRGPHKLKAEDVAANQSARLVDAIVELVALSGYHGMSVADVLELAGVSRRSFYELFSDREDLLRRAFALTADAALEELRAISESSADDPLELLIGRLCRTAEEKPGLISLWSAEIAAASGEGLALRARLMRECAELIGRCVSSNGDRPLPSVLATTLAGALQRTIAARERDPRAGDLAQLPVQLARWVRSYCPIPEGLELEQGGSWPIPPNGLVGGRAPGTLTLAPAGPLARLGRSSAGFRAHATRERVLDAAAQIVAESGYASLTAERIVARAEIPQSAFNAQFSGSDEAFTAALEVGHMKAQAVVERIVSGSSSWRSGVGASIAALLELLASEPCFTHLAFVEALHARHATARRTNEHAAIYAQLLFEGAPRRRRPPAIAAEAIVHGLFELAYQHAAEDRVAELPGAGAQAAYLAFAPFLGTSEAAGLVRG